MYGVTYKNLQIVIKSGEKVTERFRYIFRAEAKYWQRQILLGLQCENSCVTMADNTTHRFLGRGNTIYRA